MRFKRAPGKERAADQEKRSDLGRLISHAPLAGAGNGSDCVGLDRRGRKGKAGLQALLEIGQFFIVRAGAVGSPPRAPGVSLGKGPLRNPEGGSKAAGGGGGLSPAVAVPRRAGGSAPRICVQQDAPALPTLLAPPDSAGTRVGWASRGTPAPSGSPSRQPARLELQLAEAS